MRDPQLFTVLSLLVHLSTIVTPLLDCKTVVFGHFRKGRSAVSVILAWEAREPRENKARGEKTIACEKRRENDSLRAGSHALRREQKNRRASKRISERSYLARRPFLVPGPISDHVMILLRILPFKFSNGRVFMNE